MSKNDTISKKLAKKAIKPETPKELQKRIKTSIYINSDLWDNFRAITAYPRGRTSEILEDFIGEYLKLNSKR
jgi:hypothetical protein